jgi:hypothetical protein
VPCDDCEKDLSLTDSRALKAEDVLGGTCVGKFYEWRLKNGGGTHTDFDAPFVVLADIFYAQSIGGRVFSNSTLGGRCRARTCDLLCVKQMFCRLN